MRVATRGLYPSLIRSGVEIYEYGPQILHAKMVIADSTIYIGSANLDARSLSINYEVLARIPDATLAEQGREIFEADLQHCARMERLPTRTKGYILRSLERMAYFILARIDPYLARRQRRNLLRG
jgi:cardiolipin synthase